MCLSDRSSTIGHVLISGSLMQIEQLTGFKTQDYLALEPGSWELALARRIQPSRALRIWILGVREFCSATGLQNLPPTAARKSFLFRLTVLCHPNGYIQAA